MIKVRLPFASYNLWSLFTSPVGKECWFCDMKRGFNKVRQKERKVKALLEQDNKYQGIGILAQKGVYAFHQDLKLLHQSDCVERVAEVLRLNQELDEVRERVIFILTNYKKKPILV